MIRLPLPQKIETERLLLERLRYEDAEEIFYSYASKPEATKYLSWETHKTIDETRMFLDYAVPSWDNGTDFAYSIRLKNRLFIGGIGISNDNGKIQFGYAISPLHWGHGYTTEACSRLLGIVKTMKGVYRIGTFVDCENAASIRVLQKCGLIEEARLPKWFRFINQGNRVKDCLFFRLLP